MSDTRDRLREAALRLFCERGYAKTTIGEIEAHAGLAPRAGGFYRHFASKAQLAAEIGETSIIETRQDLGFDGVLPLGDTRAELILIARGYLRAAKRQAPIAALIAEVRNLDTIRELEGRVDQDLMAAFCEWLSAKPHAKGMDAAGLAALTLSIVGGWTLFLEKRESPARPTALTDERMLDAWAGTWAAVLDEPPPAP
jgi:AcrR family transcriptional regulator